MRHVSWVSENGRTVTLDATGPFFFNTLTSDLGATAETSRAPRQNGITTHHTALDNFGINLTGSMRVFGSTTNPAIAEYDRKRAWLHQAFAPNRFGILTYYKEDEAVQVRCRPVSTPTISPPVGTYSTIDIDFTTDSPFWETAQEYVISLGQIMRFWHFPWAPILRPMGAFNRFADIINPSVENIYPSVEIYTTGQYVTVTNQTAAKYVKIEQPIAADEKLVVDLRDASAFLYKRNVEGDYVLLADVSHWMSLDSDPWGIAPGSNRIAITNDVPEDTPMAYIKYRIPSLGV